MANSPQDKSHLLKRLKVEKILLSPRLSSALKPEVRDAFDSPWAPVERMAELLSLLPTNCLAFLIAQPTGAIVITAAEEGYERVPQQVGGQRVENAALVSAESLLGDGVSALREVARLYDHLLGSNGAADGYNLSDGGGITSRWAEVGTRVAELFALRHNSDPWCQRSPADYFAQSVALYAVKPAALNVADPLMHKLLKRSFFSETFWEDKR